MAPSLTPVDLPLFFSWTGIEAVPHLPLFVFEVDKGKVTEKALRTGEQFWHV